MLISCKPGGYQDSRNPDLYRKQPCDSRRNTSWPSLRETACVQGRSTSSKPNEGSHYIPHSMIQTQLHSYQNRATELSLGKSTNPLVDCFQAAAYNTRVTRSAPPLKVEAIGLVLFVRNSHSRFQPVFPAHPDLFSAPLTFRPFFPRCLLVDTQQQPV